MRGLVVRLIIVVTLVITPVACSRYVYAAVSYANPSAHYSMTLPDGWVRTPHADIVSMFKALASQTGTVEQKYEVGFHRDGSDSFTYPYILVQNHKIDMPSYDEIEAAFSGTKLSAHKITSQLSELIANTNVTNIQLDQTHNMYSYDMVMDVQTVGKVYTRALNFFGKHSLDSVYINDTIKDAAATREVESAILASFAYEKAYRYDAAHPAVGTQKTVDGAASAALRGGVVGATVGLCIGLIFYFTNKRKKRQRE